MTIKIKVSHLIIGVVLLGSLLWGGVALAGDPDSAGDPASTTSFSLEDLYNRLTAGTAGTQSAFTEPDAGPGTGTMHSLNDIMAAAPALDNTTGATTTQVISGTTYWGLRDGAWGLQTGTMPNNGPGSTIVPTITNQSVVAGYWSSANTVEGDTDLTAGNIVSGTTIFGVFGSAVEASGNATDGQVLTGTTYANAGGASVGTMPNNGAATLVPTTTNVAIAAGYHNGSGYVISDTDLTSVNIKSGVNLFEVEGELHGGCTCANGTLNGTRWCDNGDGTVTDLLGDSTNNNAGQCLVWLKNANCSANLVGIDKTGTLAWDDATIWSSAIINGICGLSDGSTGYEWRLPTQAELKGIINGTEAVFSSRMRAFTGVQSSLYWSSTTHRHYPANAWYVVMLDGGVNYTTKGDDYYVWPVRGGQ